VGLVLTSLSKVGLSVSITAMHAVSPAVFDSKLIVNDYVVIVVRDGLVDQAGSVTTDLEPIAKLLRVN